MIRLNEVQNSLLQSRLLSRIREIELFIKLAPELERSRDTSVDVIVNETTIPIGRGTYLLDAIADGATLMARGLIQFLGISFNKNGEEIVYQSKQTDITVVALGLETLTVEKIARAIGIDQNDVKYALHLCVTTANRVSGHVTSDSAKSLNVEIGSLVESFNIILRIFDNCVYGALNMDRSKL